MAWSDEPTPAQLSAIHRLIEWKVPKETTTSALEYLENTATRREVSDEMKRLRSLYVDHRLDKNNVFSSGIWEGFKK